MSVMQIGKLIQAWENKGLLIEVRLTRLLRLNKESFRTRFISYALFRCCRGLIGPYRLFSVVAMVTL